jgi:nicotinamide-nucleotide amidase
VAEQREIADSTHTVAILSTGDEVVEGRTVDTNASYIADRVAQLGYDVVCKLVVGDFPDRLEWAWKTALAQADVVISTGGLGPTTDDLTNETLARVAGVDLVLDEAEVAKIRGFFARVGRPMPENNVRQAMLPAGSEVVPNNLGTAPGYRLAIPTDTRRPVGVVLPGVPREMRAMLEETVLPWLAARLGPARAVVSRTFQTFGMGESAIDEAVAGLVPPEEARLAFRAAFPQVAVRVSAHGTREEAERRVKLYGDKIAARLGSVIYAEGSTTMEACVGELLRERGKTLATAESCTGGMVGNRLTNVPGSSTYYIGGVVAYSNKLKEKLLGVSRTTLSMFGAVSEETAREMAIGARRVTGADIAVATTGIAGPDGGTPDKPVGTVAVALAADGYGEDGAKSKIYQLWGNREWVKVLTSQVALDWVRRALLGLNPLESGFGQKKGKR